MKLNKEGRSYFREVTACFIDIYLKTREHKHKMPESSTAKAEQSKRKSNK